MSHSRLTAFQDQHLSVFTSLLADFCFYFQENQTYLYCFNTSVVRTVLLLDSSSGNCEEELPKKPVGRQVFWGALLHNYPSSCVNRHKDTLKCDALNSQPSVTSQSQSQSFHNLLLSVTWIFCNMTPQVVHMIQSLCQERANHIYFHQ